MAKRLNGEWVDYKTPVKSATAILNASLDAAHEEKMAAAERSRAAALSRGEGGRVARKAFEVLSAAGDHRAARSPTHPTDDDGSPGRPSSPTPPRGRSPEEAVTARARARTLWRRAAHAATASRASGHLGDPPGGPSLRTALALAAEEEGIVLTAVADVGKPLNCPEVVSTLSTHPTARNAADLLALTLAAPRAMPHLAAAAAAAAAREGKGNGTELVAPLTGLGLLGCVTYARFDPGTVVFTDDGTALSDGAEADHRAYMVLAGNARGVGPDGADVALGPGDAFVDLRAASVAAGWGEGASALRSAAAVETGNPRDPGEGAGDASGKVAHGREGGGLPLPLECAVLDAASFASVVRAAVDANAAFVAGDPRFAAALTTLTVPRRSRTDADHRRLAAACTGSTFRAFRASPAVLANLPSSSSSPSPSSPSSSSPPPDDDEAIDAVVLAALERASPLVLSPGRAVYAAGDPVTVDVGGAFFVLSGAVNVAVPGGKSLRLGPREAFGLDALDLKGALDETRRAETVTAAEAGLATLAVLPWREHGLAVKAAARRLRARRVDQLRSLSHLAGAAAPALARLAACSRSEPVPRGATVVELGRPCDRVYWVEAGEFDVFVSTSVSASTTSTAVPGLSSGMTGRPASSPGRCRPHRHGIHVPGRALGRASRRGLDGGASMDTWGHVAVIGSGESFGEVCALASVVDSGSGVKGGGEVTVSGVMVRARTTGSRLLSVAGIDLGAVMPPDRTLAMFKAGERREAVYGMRAQSGLAASAAEDDTTTGLRSVRPGSARGSTSVASGRPRSAASGRPRSGAHDRLAHLPLFIAASRGAGRGSSPPRGALLKYASDSSGKVVLEVTGPSRDTPTDATTGASVAGTTERAESSRSFETFRSIDNHAAHSPRSPDGAARPVSTPSRRHLFRKPGRSVALSSTVATPPYHGDPAVEWAPSFRAMGEVLCGGGRNGRSDGGGTDARLRSAHPQQRGSGARLTGHESGVQTKEALTNGRSRRPASARVSSRLIEGEPGGRPRLRPAGDGTIPTGIHGPGIGIGKAGLGKNRTPFTERLREAPMARRQRSGGGGYDGGDHRDFVGGASGTLWRNVGDVGHVGGPYSDDGAQFVVPKFHSDKGFNIGTGWF